MEQNQELRNAWEFVEHTGVSIFLTGKAGTGKTTFLRQLRRHSSKTMIVVAPTGVAAVNAEGVTIHSFFQLPLSPYVPGSDLRDKYGFSKEKLKIVRALDLLVIDEISMVRADLLDAIDATLRKYRRSAQPFGGVQLLMIGDLQQLAPVVTPADEALLAPYYRTSYFFGSRALSAIPYVTIQLTKVFRQQDSGFISLLNHVRQGVLTPADRVMLKARENPGFNPGYKSDYIRLTTHNALADRYNETALANLGGNARTYSALVRGTFPESSFPTADRLRLKVGAQVMFIKNDNEGDRFYNGLIGHVAAMGDDAVQVVCPGRDEPIEVVPQQWENAKYTVDPETLKVDTVVQGTFSQLPLRLAWAVTIHKSQGLTFDHVVIDAGASFAPGQVYVALSRCRTLEGIVLATPISDQSILNDRQVSEYIAGQDAATARSLGCLDGIKEAYRTQLLREVFNFSDITQVQESLRRLFARELSHSYPAASSTQAELADSLRDKVTGVADKWLALLATMSPEATRTPQFLKRVGDGCRYFADTLNALVVPALKEAGAVSVGDKKVMSRLHTLVADLRYACDSRVRLLESLAVEGFSIANYLNCKQTAALGAIDSAHEAKTARTRKAKAPKEPKPKPAPSREASLKMLRQGMTREEIAAERNLTIGTVTRHLQSYVDENELDIEEVYGTALVNAMESVIATLGLEEGVRPLADALSPTGLTYSDISYYLRKRQ